MCLLKATIFSCKFEDYFVVNSFFLHQVIHTKAGFNMKCNVMLRISPVYAEQCLNWLIRTGDVAVAEGNRNKFFSEKSTDKEKNR